MGILMFILGVIATITAIAIRRYLQLIKLRNKHHLLKFEPKHENKYNQSVFYEICKLKNLIEYYEKNII